MASLPVRGRPRTRDVLKRISLRTCPLDRTKRKFRYSGPL